MFELSPQDKQAKQDMIERRDAARARELAASRQAMSNFEYQCVTDSEDVEVWRCGRSDSNINHFYITVLPSGMSVVGDIDGMLFAVGKSRGIPFFAHEDKAYVASKLEAQSRPSAFDRDGFTGYVVELCLERLQELLPPDENGQRTYLERPGASVPEKISKGAGANPSLAELDAWLESASRPGSPEETGLSEQAKFSGQDVNYVQSQITGAEVLVWTAGRVDSLPAAYHFFSTHGGYFGGVDFTNSAFEVPDPNLVRRLYMLEIAADEIAQIKQREAAVVGESPRP